MRTDIHRPSVIDPLAYTFVALGHQRIESIEDCYMVKAERETLRNHMAMTGGTWSKHAHKGNCAVCGAHCIWTVIFYHPSTNVYIRTGMDCAEKLEMGDAIRFKKFRDAVLAAEYNMAGKIKAQKILEENNLSRAWGIYLAIGKTSFHEKPTEEETVSNIVGNLVRYGGLTEKQINFLGFLIQKIDKRAEIEAARAVEKAAALPVPLGRKMVTAEVVSVKEHSSDYGTRLVMTVKASDGWLAWGTALPGVQRGDKIKFTATFKASDNDPKFGFFSRAKV